MSWKVSPSNSDLDLPKSRHSAGLASIQEPSMSITARPIADGSSVRASLSPSWCNRPSRRSTAFSRAMGSRVSGIGKILSESASMCRQATKGAIEARPERSGKRYVVRESCSLRIPARDSGFERAPSRPSSVLTNRLDKCVPWLALTGAGQLSLQGTWWLPSRLVPHCHCPRAELQPAHELQVDILR